MAPSNPDFTPPPWVQSPSEVGRWIDATHPTSKTKGKKHVPSGEEILWNLHVRFDLDVEQQKIAAPTIFAKVIASMTGNGFVEEDFDLVPTAELVLRGLAKAKFKDLTKIVVDNKVVSHHSDHSQNLRKTIDDFDWIPPDAQARESIEVTVASKEGMRSIAIVKIMKIHKEKDHAVEIQIKGGIKKDLYHTFLNYLIERLGLKT